MDAFKTDFRCITMDQRNANGGESTGPLAVEAPWSAFAEDQLGLMDHLGIREFFFMGYCIGGPFALKLIERVPERVAAAVLCQPVGHRPENPDYMYNSGKDVWAPELLKRRFDLTMAQVEGLSAEPVSGAARFRVQRDARLRAQLPDANASAARRYAGSPAANLDRHRLTRAKGRDHGLPLEGAARAQGAHDRPRPDLPEGAPAEDSHAVAYIPLRRRTAPNTWLAGFEGG
jgi:pimeloyl-ACP methyl ester carboxylesterase